LETMASAIAGTSRAGDIYIYRERERERRDRDNRSQALGVSRASPCNRRRGEHAAAPGPCSQVITLLPKVGGCQEHLALAVLYVPYSALTVLYVPYSALTVLYVPYSALTVLYVPYSALTVLYVPYSALTVLYVPYSLDSRPGAYSSSSVLLSSLELSDTKVYEPGLGLRFRTWCIATRLRSQR